jgi:hypothetical protein
MGNISDERRQATAVAATARADAEAETTALCSALRVLNFLLARFNIPGLLLGKAGVIVTESGSGSSSTTASAVPAVLTKQLEALWDPALLQRLCRGVMFPLHDAVSLRSSEVDRENVRLALETSSVQVRFQIRFHSVLVQFRSVSIGSSGRLF